jgi:hypothetical protein
MPWTPPVTEAHLRRLLAAVARSIPAGGVIRASAPWTHECALHWLLSLAMARLRRAGLSAGVRGATYRGLAAPPRPPAQIAVLLDAPAYPDLGPWLSPPPGQVNILAGPAGDFRAMGARPCFLAAGRDPDFPRRAASYRQTLAAALDAAGAGAWDAALLNGLGCDLPAGSAIPKIAAGGSLPTQWLMWTEVMRRGIDVRGRLDAMGSACPERARRRFALRRRVTPGSRA